MAVCCLLLARKSDDMPLVKDSGQPVYDTGVNLLRMLKASYKVWTARACFSPRLCCMPPHVVFNFRYSSFTHIFLRPSASWTRTAR